MSNDDEVLDHGVGLTPRRRVLLIAGLILVVALLTTVVLIGRDDRSRVPLANTSIASAVVVPDFDSLGSAGSGTSQGPNSYYLTCPADSRCIAARVSARTRTAIASSVQQELGATKLRQVTDQRLRSGALATRFVDATVPSGHLVVLIARTKPRLGDDEDPNFPTISATTVKVGLYVTARLSKNPMEDDDAAGFRALTSALERVIADPRLLA